MADNADVSLDDIPVELPPPFEKLIEEIRSDRKVLLRESAYTDPVQLRAFIGQYLYPRIMAAVKLLAGGMVDTYGLAVSNTNHLHRLHAEMSRQLYKLGADVDDREMDLPGPSPELLDEFQQAFYAVGNGLQQKLPNDEEMQKLWNRAASILSSIQSELMGYDDHEDDVRDSDDDDDRDDDDPTGEDDDRDDDSDRDDDQSAKKSPPAKEGAPAEETAPPPKAEGKSTPKKGSSAKGSSAKGGGSAKGGKEKT